MRIFFLLIPIVVTALGLTYAVDLPKETVLGVPLVGYGSAQAWIAMGGVGVLSLGGGAGVVMIGFYGFGLLFGVGQIGLSAGIGVGQLGCGSTLFVGQVGGALTGIAQGFLGVLGIGQVSASLDGTEFFTTLQKDLIETTSLRFPKS